MCTNSKNPFSSSSMVVEHSEKYGQTALPEAEIGKYAGKATSIKAGMHGAR
jgi:hypothetical protein